MGVADYFSRHPTSKAIPTSKDDETFVINLIDSFKFLLKKADKISSNRNAESGLEQNDVMNAKDRKQTKQHAFSHLLHTIPVAISHSDFSNIVIVCTTNRPNRNTNEQTIRKRSRGPNKNKMSSKHNSGSSPDITQKNKNNTGTPPVGISIGTQTKNSSNIGRGLKLLNPLIFKNPFDDITLENSPNYLLKLHRVLGEAFIAEAIKKKIPPATRYADS